MNGLSDVTHVCVYGGGGGGGKIQSLHGFWLVRIESYCDIWLLAPCCLLSCIGNRAILCFNLFIPVCEISSFIFMFWFGCRAQAVA